MKPILFDLDGTLIDSSPSILKCYQAVLDEAQMSPKVPLSPTLIGPPLPFTMKQVTGVEDIDQLEHLTGRFKALYDSHIYRESIAYGGVDELLFTLFQRGHTLYIATNKRLGPSLKILEYLGWNHLFRTIMGCDSRTPGFTNKSETLSFLMTQEKLPPHGAVYVGDRLDDFKAAQFCGIDFLAATWGYCDVDWNREHPREVCLNPSDILQRVFHSISNDT
jgi:phosphoglycolate phosphatase